MKLTATLVILCSASGLSLPANISTGTPTMALNACPAVSLDATTNVWKSYTLHPNSLYRAKIKAASEIITDLTLKKKALEITGVGTFVWM
jgi:cellulose 1,4-beta-cellobiosidase